MLLQNKKITPKKTVDHPTLGTTRTQGEGLIQLLGHPL